MIVAIIASVMIGAFFGAALMACLSKPEVDLYPAQMKLRFEKEREENAN